MTWSLTKGSTPAHAAVGGIVSWTLVNPPDGSKAGHGQDLGKASTVYKVSWMHEGKQKSKEIGTLFHLGEWLQNLHYWGVKVDSITIQRVDDAR